MTYTIDKRTDVLDVDLTTSTEKSKVRQIYCQSHLKAILHRFFNTSQKYCQLMKMVLISKIWLGPAASPLFLAPLFPLPPPATGVPAECCECAIKYQEIDDNWIVSFKNTTRTICSRKVREIEPWSLILDPPHPPNKGGGVRVSKKWFDQFSRYLRPFLVDNSFWANIFWW